MVPNGQLRNMKIGVDPKDTRRVEFVVFGLDLYHGVPLLCDCTQVSPLACNGLPHPKAATEAGVCIERAENRKTATYREAAVAGGQVRLDRHARVRGRRPVE